MRYRVLLIEDEQRIGRKYKKSLRANKFRVIKISDGTELSKVLKKYGKDYFDVILSDTELRDLDGPRAISSALEEKILEPTRTLIMGMSSEIKNQEYWRGIANIGAFYQKTESYEERIGEITLQCLRNFLMGGIWKERIPRLTE